CPRVPARRGPAPGRTVAPTGTAVRRPARYGVLVEFFTLGRPSRVLGLPPGDPRLDGRQLPRGRAAATTRANARSPCRSRRLRGGAGSRFGMGSLSNFSLWAARARRTACRLATRAWTVASFHDAAPPQCEP